MASIVNILVRVIVLLLLGGFLVYGAPLSYRVVDSLPHSSNSFTQGLLWHNDTLIESTGTPGGGTRVILLDAQNGKELISTAVDHSFFGEGIAKMGNHLYQLSWQAGFVALLDFPSLRYITKIPLQGEGWGLTSSQDQLFLTNGSDTLYTYSSTFILRAKVAVTYQGNPVDNLNELEYVEGKIYANRWFSDTIFVIEPSSGIVESVVDFSALVDQVGAYKEGSVLNGIAYDSTLSLFYITGKFWPTIYKVVLEQ